MGDMLSAPGTAGGRDGDRAKRGIVRFRSYTVHGRVDSPSAPRGETGTGPCPMGAKGTHMKRTWLALALLALAGPAISAEDDKQPNVGKEAPELQTREWINSDGRTTLADLKGEVVLVAAWKTG